MSAAAEAVDATKPPQIVLKSIPKSPKATLGDLLLCAQFSSDFTRTMGKWRDKRGYMVVIDDPNLLIDRICSTVTALRCPVVWLPGHRRPDVT